VTGIVKNMRRAIKKFGNPVDLSFKARNCKIFKGFPEQEEGRTLTYFFLNTY